MSKKIEDDRKIKASAEFMITASWPESSDDDVDTYVEDPLGNIVFFNRPNEGLMHLDRDDLGKRSDTIQSADGTIYVVKENKEIVTLRGIIPGEYVVNVHMYLDRQKDVPTPVNVKLEKLNPQVRIVTASKLMLGNTADEQTAFRFVIDAAGNVTDTSTLRKQLAKATPYDETEFIYNQYGD